jgi:hypothetical protein
MNDEKRTMNNEDENFSLFTINCSLLSHTKQQHFVVNKFILTRDHNSETESPANFAGLLF